jgi:hypothetical protein
MIVLAIVIPDQRTIYLVNDGDALATVWVAGQEKNVAPSKIETLVIASKKKTETMTVAFAGGVSRESWDVDITTRTGSIHPVRAYALRGEHCFVLVDAAGYYGKKKAPKPFVVVKAFAKTHRLEHDGTYFTTLPPGPLPEKLANELSNDEVLWLSPIACDVLATGDAVRAWEDELARKMKR